MIPLFLYFPLFQTNNYIINHGRLFFVLIIHSLAPIVTVVTQVCSVYLVGSHGEAKPVDKPFVYQDIFENAQPDSTKYRKITSDYVSTIEVDGKKILKVAPEGLT